MLISLSVNRPESSVLVSEALIPLLDKYQIVCFHGDLGAGKTTFIKQLCNDLGVVSETSSPSFSIVNEYTTKENRTLYHFDLYRLKHSDEILDIGWLDYLNSGNSTFVEWPELASDYMPDDALHVHIETNVDGSRSVQIKDHL